MRKLLALTALASGPLLALSLAASASAADLAASCVGCHGPDGASTDQNIPVIGGLSATNIASDLEDYKKKARPCAEVTVPAGDQKGTKSDMCKVAAALSPADIESLSKTFSAKTFVRFKQPSDAALAAKGKELQEKLCSKCHTEGGTVADDDSSILAGQPVAYLKEQMNDFKSGKRPMTAKMKPQFDQVQPSDFDAIAQYFASFK